MLLHFATDWHQYNVQTGSFGANFKHGIAEAVEQLCALSTERGQVPLKCSGCGVELSAHRAGVCEQGIQRYSMTILYSLTGTTNLTLNQGVTTFCHWHQYNVQTGSFSADFKHVIAEMVGHLCALSTEWGHVPSGCSGWKVGLSAHRAGVCEQSIQRDSMTILYSITGTTNLTLDHDITTLCH